MPEQANGSEEHHANNVVEPGSERPPYKWALVAGAAVFALYALTLARTTAFWDTSEYIATGHILGVPHPPGNPLFVVFARAWDVLLAPLGLSTAVKINLFSAFMSATAHALWFLVIHHVLRFFSEDRIFRLGGAATAVLVSATAFTVWNQSNVNEKVYTVSLMTIALLSWLAFRWQENLGKGKDDNLLVLMAFILALSVGNHLMAFLAAPAILVFILLVRPRTLMDWKLYAAVVAAGLVGLSIHLFLPIRAALNPIINEGAPTCESIIGALASIATYGQAGCEGLAESLNRTQYDKPSIFSSPLNRDLPRTPSLFAAQLVNYLQYFDWQWSRGVQGMTELFAQLRVPFTMLFTGLGVWGALEHHRRDRASFWYVLVLFATVSVGLTFYLNFKYGYSAPSPFEGFQFREVRERDYFFIVSFSVWGLWAGVGIVAVWQWLKERTGSWATSSPVLLVAAVPLVLNWSWADRSYDYAARDWAYNLLMSVEPYAVLFTNGDNDTFPLWYLQETEGIRRDVTVIVTSYLNTPWYAKQLKELTKPCPSGVSAKDDPTRILCQREYEPGSVTYTEDPSSVAEGVVALRLDAPIQRPTRTILELEDEEIELFGRTYQLLPSDQPIQLGPITSVLPGGMEVYPWHAYALRIVNTALSDGRPVYFATSGNNAPELGLGQHLYRQGLAFKVHPMTTDVPLPEGVVSLPAQLAPLTGQWLDVDRTDKLLSEVFVHRSDLPNWSHWPDHSTAGIPSYYAWAYYALAQAALDAGREEEVDRYMGPADAWTELSRR